MGLTSASDFSIEFAMLCSIAQVSAELKTSIGVYEIIDILCR